MELQLALDLVNISEAKEVVQEVQEYIDIVEIGTPVVINEGLKAVKEIKEAFPSLKVLADLKIMDAGAYEVMKAYEAGASIITILGATDDSTIKGAVEEAKKQGTQILVDMINVKTLNNVQKKSMHSVLTISVYTQGMIFKLKEKPRSSSFKRLNEL
jgi:3-hexulose-6-phosphate synthase